MRVRACASNVLASFTGGSIPSLRSSFILFLFIPIISRKRREEKKPNYAFYIFEWSVFSLESPSPSDIRVSGSALSDGSSGVSAALSVASAGGVLTPWDSDLEADPDPPDWTRNLDPDVVDKMTPKEKQRQEVINGK